MIILGNSRRSLPWKIYSSNKPYNNPLNFVMDYAFIPMLYLLRGNIVFQAIVGCGMLPSRWIGGSAFIPISMYNGKRGFIKGAVGKYFFYAIYPLHLLAIYLFKTFI